MTSQAHQQHNPQGRGGPQEMLCLEPHAWQQVLVVAASPDVEGDFEQVTLRTVVYYQLLVFL